MRKGRRRGCGQRCTVYGVESSMLRRKENKGRKGATEAECRTAWPSVGFLSSGPVRIRQPCAHCLFLGLAAAAPVVPSSSMDHVIRCLWGMLLPNIVKSGSAVTSLSLFRNPGHHASPLRLYLPRWLRLPTFTKQHLPSRRHIP